MLTLLAAAFAAEPAMLDVQIGLAPAPLAHVQVPAEPGITTHHITSGVEMDATVWVWKDKAGELQMSFAVMPTSRKVRGVDGEVGDVLQGYVDHGHWPFPLDTRGLAVQNPGAMTELFVGSVFEGADGKSVQYGLKVSVRPASVL